MRKFDIPCPEVQLLRKHVLVMSFIGQDQKPAPKLKDARMSQADAEDAYDQVVCVSITNFLPISVCSFDAFKQTIYHYVPYTASFLTLILIEQKVLSLCQQYRV